MVFHYINRNTIPRISIIFKNFKKDNLYRNIVMQSTYIIDSDNESEEEETKTIQQSFFLKKT